MKKILKLYLLLLGCRPEGRLTEQHDIFIGVGDKLKSLIPEIKRFWPEAKGRIHIDVWREVSMVDGYEIIIEETQDSEMINDTSGKKLFFINLGGYKPGDFEEYHYKMLCVAGDKSEAVKKSKETAFYRHFGFPGADSHLDDKYGIDVDDVYEIEDLLSDDIKQRLRIHVVASDNKANVDQMHIGYLKLEKIK